MGRVHLFLNYQRPRSEGRRVRPAWHVDVAAATNAFAALEVQGFQLGDLIFNYPPPADRPDEVMEIDRSRFGPRDLILNSTRPERGRQRRKYVQEGKTTLEKDIQQLWAPFIRHSERLQMVLQPDAAQFLTTERASRRNVTINEREGARYKEVITEAGFRKEREYATPAFVLRLREMWPGGPGYVGFFGMDSTLTLLVSNILRHRHPELLRETGFAMLELRGDIPERTPDLRCALDWKSEIILRAPAK